MRLRDNSLLTAGPLILILAMSAIGLMVFYQTYSLPQQLREKIEEDYLQNKKEDLIGYIKLATNAIKHLHGPGLILTDEEAKEEAKKILTNLKYSEEDGYFFVYDFSGTNIVHPVKEDWIDRNKWDYKDNTGKYVIRDLIKAAREGDGFEEYIFHKPSVIEDKGRSKLAYVIVLPDWNWIIGTGVYLDDVDSFLKGIDDKVKSHTDNAMIWIFLIACLSMLTLSFAQRRIEKLIVLNDMAIELHKSVQQELVYIIREIGSQLEEARESTMASENLNLFVKLKKSARRALKWINDVQDGKDPSNPELIDGLNEVIENFKERERHIPVRLIPSNGAEIRLNNLSKTIKTALIETTREALTNVGKHACATHVEIQLDYSGCNVIMVIQDDGIGFEPDYVKRGIGLNNIEQRIKKVGGTIHFTPSPEGTTITVIAPLHYRNFLLCHMKHR